MLGAPAQGAKDAKLSTEGPQSSGTAPNSGTHAGWSVSNGSTGGPDSGGGGGAARRGLGGTTTLSDGLGPPSNCRALLSNVRARLVPSPRMGPQEEKQRRSAARHLACAASARGPASPNAANGGSSAAPAVCQRAAAAAGGPQRHPAGDARRRQPEGAGRGHVRQGARRALRRQHQSFAKPNPMLPPTCGLPRRRSPWRRQGAVGSGRQHAATRLRPAAAPLAPAPPGGQGVRACVLLTRAEAGRRKGRHALRLSRLGGLPCTRL